MIFFFNLWELWDNEQGGGDVFCFEHDNCWDKAVTTFVLYWNQISGQRTAMDDAGRKGFEKGRAEGVIVTARNLKQLGVPLEAIVQATGLPLAEVEML